MSFCDQFKNIDYHALHENILSKTDVDVKSALAKDKLTFDDFLALLSEAAESYIEQMAQKARAITRQRFGNVMNLYAPLYLSNECTSSCVYCGFNKNNKIQRVTLTVDEAFREAGLLYDNKMRDILLVSGDAPHIVTMDYLREIISKLHEKFASIAVEIYPLTRNGYEQLESVGCDGLTVYQETYDEKLYKTLHVKGKKSEFSHRLATPDHGGQALIRRLGIGILLGLGDFRADCAMLSRHAGYLMKRYWRSKVSVSFPRMRPAEGGFLPIHKVSDLNLLQVITAFRIYYNDIGIVLSTRESESLRDNILPLGITQMSAGSKTNPGGYLINTNSCEQFEVEDNRTPAEVSKRLSELGYDPVFKDWEA